jgi:hypothetical protein
MKIEQRKKGFHGNRGMFAWRRRLFAAAFFGMESGVHTRPVGTSWVSTSFFRQKVRLYLLCAAHNKAWEAMNARECPVGVGQGWGSFDGSPLYHPTVTPMWSCPSIGLQILRNRVDHSTASSREGDWGRCLVEDRSAAGGEVLF